MKVWEFEEAVWKKDTIRIVIRAAANSEVEDYEYQNAAQGNRNITWFLNTRVRSHSRVGDYEIVVIGGDGKQPFGGTYIQTVRDSYS